VIFAGFPGNMHVTSPQMRSRMLCGRIVLFNISF
jgi:hypothetical protein